MTAQRKSFPVVLSGDDKDDSGASVSGDTNTNCDETDEHTTDNIMKAIEKCESSIKGAETILEEDQVL